MQVNENGALSFRFSFTSTNINPINFITSIRSVIAPYWTDLSIGRGGDIFYRMTTDADTLERARSLAHEQFPTVDFQPSNVIVATWYQVPHSRLGSAQMVSHYRWSLIMSLYYVPYLLSSQVNSFQAALVYNNEISFALFFYEEATVQVGSVIVGLNSNSGPAFTSSTANIEETSNTGVTGFYAYRVDTSVILQPGGMLSIFSACIIAIITSRYTSIV